MEPTIQEGNSIFVEKISQKVDKLSKGDIIAFQSPVDEKSLIKRIIGIAGDKIEIKDGKVIVNGATLKEPYILGGVTSGSLSVVVPKNQLFVLGDNRANSLDSRYFGCIDTKAVEGRAFVRYYPFNEIRTFSATDSTK
jgi:signal peptidase I